jgi:16S rRNA (cytosine1402-N4)-methyltransferase
MKVFLDGTLGAGGHAKAILEAHPEIECYIALDRDAQALEIAKANLDAFKDRVVFRQSNFADLDQVVVELGIKEVDGFFLT